jgi:hypothetical protein
LKKNEDNKFSFTNKHSQKIYRTMGIRQVLSFHNCCYQKIREPFLTYNHHYLGGKKKKNPKKISKACPTRNSLFFANSSQETGTSSSWIFRFSKYQIHGCFQIPTTITQWAT